MNCKVCDSYRSVHPCARCQTPVCASHAGFAYRDEYQYDKESWVCHKSCRGLALVRIETIEQLENVGEFGDVIQRLANVDSENIQPEAFCQILRECGFEDRTDEKNPYPAKAITCPTCGTKNVAIK